MLVCSLLTALIFLTICRGHLAQLHNFILSPGISLAATGSFFEISHGNQPSQEKFGKAKAPVNNGLQTRLSSSSPFIRFSSIASTTEKFSSECSDSEYDYYEESESDDQTISFDYSNDDDTSTGWETFQGAFDTTDPTLFYRGRVTLDTDVRLTA